MNFLAHAFLAGSDPALVVGGVVGDWIKGPLPAGLPPDLARGVVLHRAIDSFAETHPAFMASRRRMAPARRRYAGVLVDIFYDHLLARDWVEHHTEPLSHFTARTYTLVETRLPDLPGNARPALDMMARENWLGSYARLNGIADVLCRMSRRARQPNPLAGGEEELLGDFDGFMADFRLWLTDAVVFARDWQVRQAMGEGAGGTAMG